MNDIERANLFIALFRGRTDAWGIVKGGCQKEKVTRDHYLRHLKGDVSLGIYPLLDNGTCRFFAIDLDEKNFPKALAIRDNLRSKGVMVYVALSKGKGYHIYGFSDGPMPAKNIRRVLHATLEELKIPKTEVFPKQDKLDKKNLPYGNYINLPCFNGSRMFVNSKGEPVATDLVLPALKRTSPKTVEAIIKDLPPETTIFQVAENGTKLKKKKSGKYPPCIDSIMQGAVEGSRDEAAFALARYYRDQQYTDDEILAALIQWDQRNRPPIGDVHELRKKVMSAEKGYNFGCSSIQDNDILCPFCVGDNNCAWLQNIIKAKKKDGLIKETSFYETETHIFEQIVTPDKTKASFIGFDKKTQEVRLYEKIEANPVTIYPAWGDEIVQGAVTFPTGIDDYGTTIELVDEIKTFILTYVDLPEDFLEFSIWYIILSWVYDKLTTLSYLRFEGDTGSGKSRALDVIGRLCYKPMLLAGAVTPAPIYRIIRRFRGTLILEEADFRDSSEKSEVVTLLNCGFEIGRPVIRCAKDNPEVLEILPCFGPKVFATRYKFQDNALEARCLSQIMEQTERKDIPPLLGAVFNERASKLRNKLLMWRFKNRENITQEAIEDIDLGNLEPRVKQTALPFAIPFKDMPEVLDRFKVFIKKYNDRLVAVRSESKEGKIVTAILTLAREEDKLGISASSIAAYCTDQLGLKISARYVGRIMTGMHIETNRHSVAGKVARYIVWDEKLLAKITKRYVPEYAEYIDLFPTISKNDENGENNLSDDDLSV